MTRDTKLKFLMLLFGTIAILAIGACTAVGLSETVSNSEDQPTVVPTPTSAQAEPTPTQTQTPEPETTPTPTPRNTPTPAPENTPTPAPTSTPTPTQTETPDAVESAPEDQSSVQGEPVAPGEIGRPVEFRIDKFGVVAPFEWVSVTPAGNMEAPEGWNNVAWYEPGTVPGTPGNSVVAGHYDAPGGVPAVFFQLQNLVPGDRVTIITEHNQELVFEVTELRSFHVTEVPMEQIFGASDQRNLNLITCDGSWDSSSGMYDQRLIVYTTLVSG